MAKRRDHGEGSIFLRERDGKWVARLDHGYVDGKRRRVERIADTKTEARSKLAQLKKEKEQGTQPDAQKQTLQSHMNEWLKDVKANRAFATYVQYERVWRLHLKPSLGHILLPKLTPQVLQSFLRTIQQARGDALAKECYMVLQVALQAAVRLRTIPASPLTAVEKPRHKPEERPIFSLSQLQTYLGALEGESYGVPLLLAVGLGLRRCELLGLQWVDINLDANLLQIRHALKRVEGGRVLGNPKSASGKRIIPLPSSVVKGLYRQKADQLQAKLLAGERWEETGFVFTNTVGRPLSENVLRNAHDRIVRVNDLPRLRLHDLRHCCASYLLSQGLPIKMVSEIIGHSSVAITLSIYGHVLKEQKDEAAHAMERVLRGGL